MSAFEQLKEQVTADHNYAYSLYCNLVMPMIDSGIIRDLAEDAAQQIMSNWFGLKKRTLRTLREQT